MSIAQCLQLFITLGALALPSLATASPTENSPLCDSSKLLEVVGQTLATTPAAAVTKSARESFGGIPNQKESDNFTLRWGDQSALTDEQYQQVLDFAELAYGAFAAISLPTPPGSTAFKLNIYIGNTGPNVPDINSSRGYVTVDFNGYPFMVVNKNLFTAAPHQLDFLGHTVVHEYMHMVQIGNTVFDQSSLTYSVWLWEANAEWAAARVFPLAETNYSFSGYYGIQPQLPLSYYDVSNGFGTPTSVHHYGAGIFFQYLDEFLESEDLLTGVWNSQLGYDYPMERIDDLLGEQGYSLPEVFAGFSAAQVYLDYRNASVFQKNRKAAAERFPTFDESIVGAFDTSSETFEPTQQGPSHFGYQVVKLDNLSAQQQLTIAFDDRQRSQATLVIRSNQQSRYHTFLETDNPNVLELVAAFDNEVESAAVVIAGIPAETTDASIDAAGLKRYNYTLGAKDVTNKVDEQDYAAAGGGCQSEATNGITVIIVVFALMLLGVVRE